MRRILATVALALGLLAVGAPAMAVAWGPNASYYKGVKRVTGSGDFYKSGYTYARSKMVVTDNSNDGNTVYGRTTYSFYGHQCPSGTCSTTWFTDGSKSTPEFSNATQTYWLDRGLKSWGTKARGTMEACAQMGWPVPDSCSAAAHPSFSY